MFSKTTPSKANGKAEGASMVETAAAGSKKASPRTVNSAPSIFGRDIIITGDIKTDGEVQIDGRLEGNVSAAIVTVGEQGAVNGVIKADRVHVRGKVTGKVNALAVELSETANVQADLIQDDLSIANGAYFDGKCSRKTQAPTPISKGKTKAKSA
jgi:cytoskeletal protein CcmA (bactofilin family)